jgi:hypothetical protein
MNLYKYSIGLSLALLIGGLNGCGESCCGATKKVEPAGFENIVKRDIASADGIIAKGDNQVIILTDDDHTEVARIKLLADTELKSSSDVNKCKCATTECTPCAVSVKRSCGSKAVDATQKTLDIQNGLNDTQLALLSASYDIKINKKIESGDILTKPIEVSLKVPKCVHDKTSNKYFDYDKGEVKDIKIWIEPLDSGESGYWLNKTFSLEEIKSGKLNFKVKTPNSHIVLVAVVDKPIATGATGGS